MSQNIVWKEGSAWAARNEHGRFLGHFRYKSQATKAIGHSGHEIEVVKFNAGGHPIHGWNWPKWGYRVECSCGYRTSNVAGNTKARVQSHLEAEVR